MSHLDQVLQRIDADLDSSLERLFQWLTDPLDLHRSRL